MTAGDAGDEPLVAAVVAVLADLAVWARRGEPDAGPEVRGAATDAVGGIDALMRALHERRATLVGEVRAFDDETARRVDELLRDRDGGTR